MQNPTNFMQLPDARAPCLLQCAEMLTGIAAQATSLLAARCVGHALFNRVTNVLVPARSPGIHSNRGSSESLPKKGATTMLVSNTMPFIHHPSCTLLAVKSQCWRREAFWL
jgi:hypothetical protein